ncbi:hypothetical protein ACLOJK_005433 [Asimina triloba]
MGESFKINVSEKLVNRLANDADKPKKKTKKPKPKIAQGSQQPKIAASQDAHLSSNIHKGTHSSGWPLQSPLFLPVPPPTVANAELDAIHSVLQESESVLERLQKQEANMVREVKQRAKELHDKEFKLPYQKPMPCLAEKDSCLECYRKNAKDPLRCANVVKVFADCARVARQQVSVTAANK